MDDKEFLSLDLEGAKEYMLAYATSMKRYEIDMTAVRSELALWKGRVSLAESKGAAELAAGATAKVAEIEGRLQGLEAERQNLAGELARIRERLPYLKARERSIDPDQLLAELQMMTGELLDDGGAPAAEADTGAAAPATDGTAAPTAGAPTQAANPRSAASIERDIGKLEATAKADAALEELKRRMGS